MTGLGNGPTGGRRGPRWTSARKASKLPGVRGVTVAALVAVMAIGLSGCLLTLKPAAGATVFSYTGATQTYTVPASVCGVLIDAEGAGGGLGAGAYANSPGFGAEVKTRAFVKAGDVLEVGVGGKGGDGANVLAQQPGGAGGFGFGGKGGDADQPTSQTGESFSGGGGGGASYVIKGGNGVVVAGGGGGSAGDAFLNFGEGGDGGNLGGDGTPFDANVGRSGGGGGAPASGGTPGYPNGAGGALWAGGAGGTAVGITPPNFTVVFAGGGGGGGFSGGGGGGSFDLGPGGGGGGGGSYAFPGTQFTSFTDGVQPGNGQVSITPLHCP
jgi:hypothetical protein